MIDTHIHILPALDDGSPNIDVSINMAKTAKENGFDKIIATPHFIEDSGALSAESILKNIESINEVLKNNDIEIEIYSGCEIYFTTNIVKLLENKEVLTCCDSKYFLMELPIIGKPLNYIEVLKESISKGYVPIIAHPERYEWFDKNYEEFKKLKDIGVKFQINYGSIMGLYGNMPKKNVIRLLKDNMVDLIGTDSHGNGKVYENLSQSILKIKKICGEENFKVYTETNPQRIINNKDI